MGRERDMERRMLGAWCMRRSRLRREMRSSSMRTAQWRRSSMYVRSRLRGEMVAPLVVAGRTKEDCASQAQAHARQLSVVPHRRMGRERDMERRMLGAWCMRRSRLRREMRSSSRHMRFHKGMLRSLPPQLRRVRVRTRRVQAELQS
jgi:hypothetical protein